MILVVPGLVSRWRDDGPGAVPWMTSGWARRIAIGIIVGVITLVAVGFLLGAVTDAGANPSIPGWFSHLPKPLRAVVTVVLGGPIMAGVILYAMLSILDFFNDFVVTPMIAIWRAVRRQ